MSGPSKHSVEACIFSLSGLSITGNFISNGQSLVQIVGFVDASLLMRSACADAVPDLRFEQC